MGAERLVACLAARRSCACRAAWRSVASQRAVRVVHRVRVGLRRRLGLVHADPFRPREHAAGRDLRRRVLLPADRLPHGRGPLLDLRRRPDPHQRLPPALAVSPHALPLGVRQDGSAVRSQGVRDRADRCRRGAGRRRGARGAPAVDPAVRRAAGALRADRHVVRLGSRIGAVRAWTADAGHVPLRARAGAVAVGACGGGLRAALGALGVRRRCRGGDRRTRLPRVVGSALLRSRRFSAKRGGACGCALFRFPTLAAARGGAACRRTRRRPPLLRLQRRHFRRARAGQRGGQGDHVATRVGTGRGLQPGGELRGVLAVGSLRRRASHGAGGLRLRAPGVVARARFPSPRGHAAAGLPSRRGGIGGWPSGKVRAERPLHASEPVVPVLVLRAGVSDGGARRAVAVLRRHLPHSTLPGAEAAAHGRWSAFGRNRWHRGGSRGKGGFRRAIPVR